MAAPLLDPKPVRVTTLAGDTREYIISKFPAVQGREIIAKYPVANIPKLGDYATSEEVMLKLMCYVGVPMTDAAGNPTEPRMLTTMALVNSNVPDFETLMKLEALVIDHNCSFFRDGRASTIFQSLGQKALPHLTKMLKGLLANFAQQA